MVRYCHSVLEAGRATGSCHRLKPHHPAATRQPPCRRTGHHACRMRRRVHAMPRTAASSRRSSPTAARCTCSPPTRRHRPVQPRRSSTPTQPCTCTSKACSTRRPRSPSSRSNGPPRSPAPRRSRCSPCSAGPPGLRYAGAGVSMLCQYTACGLKCMYMQRRVDRHGGRPAG